MLNPNGVIVAIAPSGLAFRQDKRTKALRELVELFGSWQDLEAGTFKEAGTLVNTLLLSIDVGVSVVCEDTIIHDILYLYLTSPYDELRESFSDLLNTWKGTSIVSKVMKSILALIPQVENAQASNPSHFLKTTSTTHSDDTLPLLSYYQAQVQQNKESLINLIKLIQ